MAFIEVLLVFFDLSWGLCASKKTNAPRRISPILGALTVLLFLWFLMGIAAMFLGIFA